MSRETFARGLRDGSSGAKPWVRDADYDRGYTLGHGDVAARIAMYDAEQRQTMRTVDDDMQPCPGSEQLRTVPSPQDCEHCGWWTRTHGASGLCEATSGSWDADETCSRWATTAFVATTRAAQERIHSDSDDGGRHG